MPIQHNLLYGVGKVPLEPKPEYLPFLRRMIPMETSRLCIREKMHSVWPLPAADTDTPAMILQFPDEALAAAGTSKVLYPKTHDRCSQVRKGPSATSYRQSLHAQKSRDGTKR